jgi:DNA-binding response OmpR family regulator
VRQTVLVIEDDRATRDLYRSALQLAGYHVLVAGDGLSALRAIQEVVFDAIVLDLDLPQVTGVAIRQELAAHPHTARVPVVVVTGTDWPVDIPPHAQLTKPISPDILVDAVTRAIRASLPSGR